MTKNQLGLIGGIFLALVHAVWSLFVAIMPAQLQQFILWIFDIHHLNVPISVTPFVFSKALVLVILTFVVGYIFGWVIGLIREIIRR